MSATQRQAMMDVEGLCVDIAIDGKMKPVVEDVSFQIGHGKTVGLVGESGCGKSVTALALAGLIGHKGGQVRSGSVQLDGRELVGLSERSWSQIRGVRIGMIFQQPTRCLNPAFRVGDQIAETVRFHEHVTRRAAWDRAIRMLERVGIKDAARRATAYPHEWSGGMCQRAMIAQALICEPELLIADEPTTALDATVQARFLALLRDIQAEMNISILLITHDLGIVAELADDIVVMYAGQVVEQGSAAVLLTEPAHPYTRALIAAVPTRGSMDLQAIRGMAPSLANRPTSGCRFLPRCDYAIEGCAVGSIEMEAAADSHLSRCIRSRELLASS